MSDETKYSSPIMSHSEIRRRASTDPLKFAARYVVLQGELIEARAEIERLKAELARKPTGYDYMISELAVQCAARELAALREKIGTLEEAILEDIPEGGISWLWLKDKIAEHFAETK